MKAAYLLLAFALPLSACNKSPEIHEKNVSVADVAQKVRDAGVGNGGFLDPGQWRTVSTLEEMDIPGASAEAQRQVLRRQGQGQLPLRKLRHERRKDGRRDELPGRTVRDGDNGHARDL